MNQTMLSDNVFKVENPDEWWCRAIDLTYGHRLMIFEVRHLHQKDRHFFLKFRKVAYFSGWLSWTGANFRIASDEEKHHFMREVLHYRDFSDEELDEQICSAGMFRTLRLFIAEGEENKHIHLIANAGGSFDSQGNTLALAPDPSFA